MNVRNSQERQHAPTSITVVYEYASPNHFRARNTAVESHPSNALHVGQPLHTGRSTHGTDLNTVIVNWANKSCSCSGSITESTVRRLIGSNPGRWRVPL